MRLSAGSACHPPYRRPRPGLPAVLYLALASLVLAACAPAAASSPPFPTHTPACPDATQAGADCFPGVQPQTASAPAPTPGHSTAAPDPTWPAPGPSAAAPTLLPVEPTPTAAAWPAPCAAETCILPDVFLLARPIAPPGRETIDTSYRFGSTQGERRDPHHGVEFLNPYGTPVLAAAPGRVVVAGDDRKTFYGPYSYFYGNLVVIQHDFPQLDHPCFTLYAHLSAISVQVGQSVQAGQEIGKIGLTGVATGSHLHFEIRLGENSYASSRNPELWLQPRPDEQGQPQGALAGRIVDAQGQVLAAESIVIQHLLGPDGPSDYELYLSPYEEKGLAGQSPWRENFAAGDLPSGWYRVSFALRGMHSRVVQVFPGELTFVTFELGKK